MSTSRGDVDDDAMTLLALLIGGAALGIVNVGAISDTAVQWLLSHHVLVAAGDAVVPLPGPVGLDLQRVIVLAGVLVICLAGVLQHRRRAERRQAQQRQAQQRYGAQG